MVLENNKATKRPQAANNNIMMRRNSTGNLHFNASPELKPLPLPNYLRASMGSCHDFCKYGMKSESISPKPTSPLPKPKKPPVLPKSPKKVGNVIKNSTSNVTKNSTSNVTIQQKMKQKVIILKHPNDVKSKPLAKEVSSSVIQVQPPSRRRFSDVYSQTHGIKNGSNHKTVCVTATVTASQSGKRGVSRNASKKDLSQSENKPRKVKTVSDFEIPVEKILYIDEMRPCKEACDHSSIQKLSSDEAIDLIDDRFSSSLSEDNINCESTTGSSCSDTLASISITSCETDSDISSNKFMSKKGRCVDEALISITSFKTDSDNSSKGNSVDKASISITSIKTDSDNSSNMFKPKKDISVDDDCKSTKTGNESIQVVVLRHHNQEEKKLVSMIKRNLVEAGKVKALVSAFEAVITLEDDKSLRTLKA